jgi:uncharacterized protein
MLKLPENIQSTGLAGVSFAHGLMTAVAVGPEAIPNSEWLSVIDDSLSGTLEGDENALFALAMTVQYKKIADSLTKSEPDYEPFFWDDADGRVVSRDWAQGFFAGIRLREKSWSSLMDGEDKSVSAMLKVLLQPEELYAKAAEAGIDADALFTKTQNDAPGLVQYIYRRWGERNPFQPVAAPLAGAKVGRNDPCPCGSGKKYKKCCLS